MSVIIIILLLTYLLPSMIALCKNHLELKAIICVNVFLGITGIGWIVSIIWAISDSTVHYLKKNREKLEAGMISQKEYEERLKRIEKN
ncbi:superinfection immunity protein [Dorea sp. D27]|uniref:superinfection immunity protein n=1 Tax=Dorea sp. D27 TaxID=658665 RepID=UPI00067380C6|nr:superinfection immunity protein [Dorea sp. D27]KMZ53410.1 putative immunity protein [Dorea sp. D27]